MTYEEFKAEADRLEWLAAKASAKLQTYPRNERGMTPDEIKFSPDYRADKNAYALAASALRNFNDRTRHLFITERRANRAARMTRKATA